MLIGFRSVHIESTFGMKVAPQVFPPSFAAEPAIMRLLTQMPVR